VAPAGRATGRARTVRGERLDQSDQREPPVGADDLVAMGPGGGHAPDQGPVPLVRGARVRPDDPVGAPAQHRQLPAEGGRIARLPPVAHDQDNGPAHGGAAVEALQRGEGVGDPGAAGPVRRERRGPAQGGAERGTPARSPAAQGGREPGEAPAAPLRGAAPGVAHLAAHQLRRGELQIVDVPGTPVETSWYATTLAPDRRSVAAGSLRRFLDTPDAMHLLRAPGAGVPPSRFRPPVYVTIWS
jgi:hypothetical protein